MIRSRLLIAAVVFALAAGLTGTPQAAAGGGSIPEDLGEIYESIPFEVNGSYLPLFVGLTCGSGGSSAIVWYAPGPAADHLWTDVTATPGGPLGFTSQRITVNGTFEPLLGDFDGDGCTDIFWYAPGPAQDYVWYLSPDTPPVSVPVTVNGTYTPVVLPDVDGSPAAVAGAPFGTADEAVGPAEPAAGPAPDRIFWVRPGPGSESLWEGTPGRGFDPVTAPAVNGTYDHIDRGFFSGVLFQDADGPDRLWQVIDGAGNVGGSATFELGGVFTAIDQALGTLLYRPGPADDFLFYDVDETSGEPLTIPGEINGTYVVGKAPPSLGMGGVPFVLWHRPGPGTDSLWIFML